MQNRYNSNNNVNIVLVNKSELGGLQFTVEYNPLLISIDSVSGTGRLSDIDLHYNEPTSGNFTVLVTDLSGQTISPGEGTVLQLKISVAQNTTPQAVNLDLDDIIFANSEGLTLSAASANGYFIVKM